MNETGLNNEFRFESDPVHDVVLKQRKNLELTGVRQIDSFDSHEFLLQTSQGWLLVQGKDLTLGKWDTEKGEVSIRGMIDKLEYILNKKENSRESMLTRFLK